MVYRRITGYGLIVTLVFMFSACNKQENPPAIKGPEYFPYSAGNERIFQVDSFLHSTLNDDIIHVPLLMKERVVQVFRNGEGEEALRIERWFSRDTGKTYTLHGVLSAGLKEDHVWWNEENRRFVKLSFPVRLNKSWNGNAYNAMGRRDYRYTAVESPFENGRMLFSDALLVQMQADSNFIERAFEREVYANDVGLVYRESIQLERQPGSVMANGHEAYFRLISFSR